MVPTLAAHWLSLKPKYSSRYEKGRHYPELVMYSIGDDYYPMAALDGSVLPLHLLLALILCCVGK